MFFSSPRTSSSSGPWIDAGMTWRRRMSLATGGAVAVENAKMNVFGVPSVAPSCVFGWPKDHVSALTALTAWMAACSSAAAP